MSEIVQILECQTLQQIRVLSLIHFIVQDERKGQADRLKVTLEQLRETEEQLQTTKAENATLSGKTQTKVQEHKFIHRWKLINVVYFLFSA